MEKFKVLEEDLELMNAIKLKNFMELEEERHRIAMAHVERAVKQLEDRREELLNDRECMNLASSILGFATSTQMITHNESDAFFKRIYVDLEEEELKNE